MLGRRIMCRRHRRWCNINRARWELDQDVTESAATTGISIVHRFDKKRRASGAYSSGANNAQGEHGNDSLPA